MDATPGPAGVSGPDTDALLLGVMQALRTLGLAPDTVQTRVEYIALIWQLTGIHSILSGTMSIACNQTLN